MLILNGKKSVPRIFFSNVNFMILFSYMNILALGYHSRIDFEGCLLDRLRRPWLVHGLGYRIGSHLNNQNPDRKGESAC